MRFPTTTNHPIEPTIHFRTHEDLPNKSPNTINLPHCNGVNRRPVQHSSRPFFGTDRGCLRITAVLSRVITIAVQHGIQQHRRTAPVVISQHLTPEQAEAVSTMVAPIVRDEEAEPCCRIEP